jgi:hypothetical protein
MEKLKHYKVHLSKSERKGKTQEEINELRIKKLKLKDKEENNVNKK